MSNSFLQFLKKRFHMDKYKIIGPVFLASFLLLPIFIFGQNVGVGLLSPAGKLHIKGSADVSQLILDANSTQSNTMPLLKLRNSFGNDLLWINSDNAANTFIGLNAGRVNAPGGTG